MREILFRGKRTDNGEWVEGSLILTTSTMEKPYIVDSCWCYDGSFNDEGYANFEYLNAYEVIPESVSEFTGLFDKNGKKIFEGDIVTSQSYLDRKLPDNSIIEYGEWNCSCCDGVYGWHCDGTVDFRDDEVIVIGNIHDKPELLKLSFKPEYLDGDPDCPICPNCRTPLNEMEDCDCGQKIDWSDTE